MQLSAPGARIDQSVGRIAALVQHGTETLANIEALVLKSDLDIKNYPMAKVCSVLRSFEQKRSIFCENDIKKIGGKTTEKFLRAKMAKLFFP